ncbi:MAG: DUF4412 domain-containing protein [Deltaproteobacteria bacterium]|jgi:hypothetical protein|nr:DUF4412 domain-containing protein [Deltaproteobacteria bacterium]
MILRKWSVLIGMAMVIWLVVPVAAGIFMVDQNGEETLIADGRLKNASEGMIWILDGPRNQVVFINVDQKVYASGTPAEYCTSISAMFDRMMKSVPEEQRKMMEQMMNKGKGASPQDVSVARSGDGGNILGFKTVKYRVLVDGELYKEVWLTTDGSLMQEYKPLIPALKKFDACTAGLNMGPSPENSPEYQKIWDSGFELKSVIYEAGSPEPETDLVRLEKKTIPESEFRVPGGYKQVSFDELLQTQME